jgi:hypothetical protein
MTDVQTPIGDETLEQTLRTMAADVGVSPERMLQIAISNQKYLLDLEQQGGEFAVDFGRGGLKRVRFLGTAGGSRS